MSQFMYLNLFLCIFLFLIIIPGIIILQLYFAKFNNMWLNLILPNIIFCLSLIITVIQIREYSSLNIEAILSITGYFFLINVLTVILVAIYFTNKNNIKKEKQIEKMNVQDL